ncbi:hypothetical protein F5Y16DRAFT_404216 [Xylariaceae sp. FL0255]|nr:hypothetical protein F5Y16DRAFT_404216 [Xylariaceae sp. FL0255]
MPLHYTLDNAINTFFESHPSATRHQCDELAVSLIGEPINPVPIQELARKVHGRLVATHTYYGQIGQSSPLSVYVMEKLPGYFTILCASVARRPNYGHKRRPTHSQRLLVKLYSRLTASQCISFLTGKESQLRGKGQQYHGIARLVAKRDMQRIVSDLQAGGALGEHNIINRADGMAIPYLELGPGADAFFAGTRKLFLDRERERRVRFASPETYGDEAYDNEGEISRYFARNTTPKETTPAPAAKPGGDPDFASAPTPEPASAPKPAETDSLQKEKKTGLSPPYEKPNTQKLALQIDSQTYRSVSALEASSQSVLRAAPDSTSALPTSLCRQRTLSGEGPTI